MSLTRNRFFYRILFVFSGFVYSVPGDALQFEPGIGAGVEYTSNAQKIPDGKSDIILASYLGARITENDGPLNYGVTGAFNRQNYTGGSFDNQSYLNLAADAGWEMIKDRVDWFASNHFSQRPVRSINSTTPNNLQDSNIFNVGANVVFPVSSLQVFTIRPVYSQYYYEVQPNDNKQLSLSANWNYQMYRRTGVGLNLSTRTIDYTEKNVSGNTIADTSFTNIAFLINGQQRHSMYTVNLGSTTVKRDGGQRSTGFAGGFTWLSELSSRSKISTRLSTDVTDTNSVIARSISDPVNGNPDDVQIATDVIRNSIFNLAYLREDASLHSRVWWEYREIKYSDSPLDRIVRALGMQLDYPVTQLLSSGLSVRYNRTRQLDSERLDDRYTVGANLHYRMSRKLFSALDLTYRRKESTQISQNYDEVAIFARLVYGFGDVQRPSSAGGF